jgi:type II secretory pathway pseudopilin PulG
MMTHVQRRHRFGFTLLEIMIIVALVGLLAVLAMPGIIKSRKQAQGRRVINDARIIDTAIDAWAIEKNKSDGDNVDITDAATYSKSGALPARDVLGNLYAIGKVGTNQVKVSSTTKMALDGVSIDWGGY